MDTKHIHCMLEKMSEYGKEMIEAGVGAGNVNLEDAGKIVDMVKDLACAEKDALIAKEMRKAHEEDESEEKYFLKMLKEEKQDEYKKMKEEYGEDEGERRFYDNYRYANGRFAPKGMGSYRPRSSGRRGRRGYEESFMPNMDEMEYMRDMDRMYNKMYYPEIVRSTGTSTATGSGEPNVNPNEMRGYSGGSTGGMSSSVGSTGGGARTMSYSDGYSDGERRGYEAGYSDGQNSGRSYQSRDYREGRSGRSRKSYMEAKERNSDGSQEGKKEKIKELEKYMGELSSDITDMISGASNDEKSMLKTKLQMLVQKIQ